MNRLDMTVQQLLRAEVSSQASRSSLQADVQQAIRQERLRQDIIMNEVPAAMRLLATSATPGGQLFTIRGLFGHTKAYAYWSVCVGAWHDRVGHVDGDPKLVAVYTDGFICWEGTRHGILWQLRLPELDDLLREIQRLGV